MLVEENYLLASDSPGVILKGSECSSCHAYFCLASVLSLVSSYLNAACCRHRHAGQHDCISQQQPVIEKKMRTAEAKEILSQNGFKTEPRVKTTDTPARPKNPQVELMKLKMKAKGNISIPEQHRLYLRVFFPKSNNRRQDLAAFVDRVSCLV